ncbi:hypothetical protein CA13_63570 [Planctomycetes bacterium CA13]|uniref:Uncharacterized protein n=1 Tax=Novipirellula herctigrandis TaxID=2527986 RepID=A0A5C5ZCJ6_9BACT|nr:hypothetical protein CA13_63570 [Planctomycetes bacterium CA13]
MSDASRIMGSKKSGGRHLRDSASLFASNGAMVKQPASSTRFVLDNGIGLAKPELIFLNDNLDDPLVNTDPFHLSFSLKKVCVSL